MSKLTFFLMLVVVAYYVQVQGQQVPQTCPANAMAPTTACDCLMPADPGRVCLNGGFCMSNNLLSFSCLCPITATGDQCQTTSSAACDPGVANCLGANSICIGVQGATGAGTGSCSCEDGFVRGLDGNAAEACVMAVNECTSNNPCANGATCVDLPFGFDCACPAGFTGNTCQTVVSTTRSSEDSDSADSASSGSSGSNSASSVDSLSR